MSTAHACILTRGLDREQLGLRVLVAGVPRLLAGPRWRSCAQAGSTQQQRLMVMVVMAVRVMVTGSALRVRR